MFKLNSVTSMIVILLLAVPGLPIPSGAPGDAIITVTTHLDEYDLSGTGEGCSLREAITAANSDAAFGGCEPGDGNDTILLPDVAIYALTITGYLDDTNATDDLDVTSTIIIQGTGQEETVIDASALGDRIFDMPAPSNLTLKDLTLTGGHALDGSEGWPGYPGREGGAISVYGNELNVERVTFAQNQAGDGGDGLDAIDPSDECYGGTGGYGGAIHGDGATISILDSTFVENTSGDGGDGGVNAIYTCAGSEAGSGGAIFLWGGILIIERSVFDRNGTGQGGQGGNGDIGTYPAEEGQGGPGGDAGLGGAIYLYDSNLAMADTEFSENFIGPAGDGGAGGTDPYSGAGLDGGFGGDGGNGGAIYQHDGSFDVSSSNFNGNLAGQGGYGGAGGVGLDGVPGTNGGNGGNGGDGGEAGSGGALYVNASSNASLEDCQFSDNQSGQGGAGGLGGQAGLGGDGLPEEIPYWGTNGGTGGDAGNAYISGGGGAIFISSTNMSITGSQFTGNSTGNGIPGRDGGHGGDGGTGGYQGFTGGAGGDGGNGGHASDGADGGHGGAIMQYLGSLTLIQSTFTNNSTGSGGAGGIGGSGGQGGQGGAEGEGGSGGTGGNGGQGGEGGHGQNGGGGGALAIYAFSTVTLVNDTFDQNTTGPSASGGNGGGGGNGGDGGVDDVTGTGGDGGDGGNGGYAGQSGYGGAISVLELGDVTLNVSFVTITRNSTSLLSGTGGLPGDRGLGGIPSGMDGLDGSYGGSPEQGQGGGISRRSGTIYLAATILADNDAIVPDCYSQDSEDFQSLGWNLIGSALYDCPLSYTGYDDFSVTTASLDLGPLVLNWGFPKTRALLSGSLALDRVPAGEAGCGVSITTDERGFPRPVNEWCDAGAYEANLTNFLPLIIH